MLQFTGLQRLGHNLAIEQFINLNFNQFNLSALSGILLRRTVVGMG